MVIKVNDINKTSELNSPKGVHKAGSGESFSAYLNETMANKPQQIGGTSGISVADAIFAAQTVGSEEEREIRKKLIKRGYSLLEKLEDIRDALLLGYMSKDKLIETARLVKDHQAESSDPKLQEIMAEIELRVEVELAKLTS